MFISTDTSLPRGSKVRSFGQLGCRYLRCAT